MLGDLEHPDRVHHSGKPHGVDDRILPDRVRVRVGLD